MSEYSTKMLRTWRAQLLAKRQRTQADECVLAEIETELMKRGVRL